MFSFYKNIKVCCVGLLIFLLSNISFAQNYSKVDSIVNLYPKNISKIDDLISKINSDFSTSTEKIRAVFFWITNNISYDVEFSKKIESQNIYAFSYKTNAELIQKEKKFNDELAIKTFNTKNGVCYGYSTLFKYLVEKLNIECKLIRGNLKSNPLQIGNSSLDVNHGWNAVKINNKWKFIDCTLAAGSISGNSQQFTFDFNDVYFFTDPELFFLNHYPEDEKWLLVDNKTKSDYLKLPLYYVAFFKINNDFILPKEGILLSKNNFEISFTKFDVNKDYFEYKFSSDKRRNLVELSQNKSNYDIPLNDKADQILYIYINGKLMAAYKIELKL